MTIPQTAYVVDPLWNRLGPDDAIREHTRVIWVSKAYGLILNHPFLRQYFTALLARTHATAPHIQGDAFGNTQEMLEYKLGATLDVILDRPGVEVPDLVALLKGPHHALNITPAAFFETIALFCQAGVEAGVRLGVLKSFVGACFDVAHLIVKRWWIEP